MGAVKEDSYGSCSSHIIGGYEMSSKEFHLAGVPPSRDGIVSVDVLGGDAVSIKKPERMKRLTIDIPEILHRQIKASCAQRGVKIADELRCLLAERYGKS